MASCLAMFTNISATIIFIARVEMYFHEKYKLYSDAVTGGRDADIQNTKRRMFRQLSNELMTLARIQFIISVVIYLVCMVILPSVGISSMTMKIYPSLAVGYFILFLMYSAIIFLYYFNDLAGQLDIHHFFIGDAGWKYFIDAVACNLVWHWCDRRFLCWMDGRVPSTALDREAYGCPCILRR